VAGRAVPRSLSPVPCWRVIDTPPADGAWNMAMDEALMEAARDGAPPTVRFYRWSPACLSLGRNQPAAERYDLEAIARLGLDVVRRPTGGRAVLHRRELTYSVVTADGLLGSPRAAYSAINAALAAGLRSLGVPVELHSRGLRRAPVPSIAPCFREPAEGEVVARGRKLIGSAQYSDRGATLQHGSLLLADDQRTVRTLLLHPEPEDDAPAVLEDLLRPLPSWETLTAALAAGLAEVTGAALEPAAIHPREAERAGALRARYADDAWTWRR
jgi:lipoyl(octanoyl) transferase